MPASFYWQGKMPAAAYFNTVPFGLLRRSVAKLWSYFSEYSLDSESLVL
jgi:TRAP-type mannitol/chloroaromatic compound transport system substrate-binding protein